MGEVGPAPRPCANHIQRPTSMRNNWWERRDGCVAAGRYVESKAERHNKNALMDPHETLVVVKPHVVKHRLCALWLKRQRNTLQLHKTIANINQQLLPSNCKVPCRGANLYNSYQAISGQHIKGMRATCRMWHFFKSTGLFIGFAQSRVMVRRWPRRLISTLRG